MLTTSRHITLHAKKTFPRIWKKNGKMTRPTRLQCHFYRSKQNGFKAWPHT